MADGVIFSRSVIPRMENDVLVFYRMLQQFVNLQTHEEFRIRVTDPRFAEPGPTVVDFLVRTRGVDGAPLTWGQIWRYQIAPRLMRTSQEAIWRRGHRVFVLAPARRRAAAVIADYFRRNPQRYRDGPTHCILSPILRYYEQLLDKAPSDKTRANINVFVNKVRQTMILYEEGVPENELDAVAAYLNVRISISDPLGENERLFNWASPRAKMFVYRNVRRDHVELETVCATTVDKATAEEMQTLWEELDAKNEFYVLRKAFNGIPCSIETLDGTIELADPDRDVAQAARSEYLLDGYAVDAQAEPELAAFTAAGCRVTSHAALWPGEVFEDDPEDAHVLDLRKAYTQGPACGDYFVGYFANISNVRKLGEDWDANVEHVRAHPGLYHVDYVDLEGVPEPAATFLYQLGLRDGGSIILASPELLYLYDVGVRFCVRGGCWGFCVPDIDWGALGLHDDSTGPVFGGTGARYKWWCGQLGFSNNGSKTVFLPGDSAWAEYLTSLGYDAQAYAQDRTVRVNIPTKKTPTLHHMFAFVTAYTRILVLKKLFTFDPAQVRGLMLDSILFIGDAPAAAEDALWRLKEDVGLERISEYARDGWYSSRGIWEGTQVGSDWIQGRPTSILDSVSFLSGAGGSGKSHAILNDPGFRRVLFAAPMWSLVAHMHAKYGHLGRDGTTIHRLAGEWVDVEVDEDGTEREVMTKCRSYIEEFRRYPPVLFVDECSMADKDMLQRIYDAFHGRTQLIFGGDIDVAGLAADSPPIWYQCRNRNAIFDPRDFGCRVHVFAEDWRATGQLVERKRALRARMREIFLASDADDPGNDALDAAAVTDSVRTLFADRVVTAADAAAAYVPGDTVLVGTHDLAAEWADRLKEKDAKYRVTSHTRADLMARMEGDTSKLLTGEISLYPVPRSIPALAFTIHSFQGKTFEGPGTLWIDARRVWDYAMLYTAISRCRRLEHLRICFE